MQNKVMLFLLFSILLCACETNTHYESVYWVNKTSVNMDVFVYASGGIETFRLSRGDSILIYEGSYKMGKDKSIAADLPVYLPPYDMDRWLSSKGYIDSVVIYNADTLIFKQKNKDIHYMMNVDEFYEVNSNGTSTTYVFRFVDDILLISQQKCPCDVSGEVAIERKEGYLVRDYRYGFWRISSSGKSYYFSESSNLGLVGNTFVYFSGFAVPSTILLSDSISYCLYDLILELQ